MSSILANSTKLGRVIKGRLALFEVVAEVTKPISRKGEKLIELIKEKASLVEKSSVGQKLMIAKEYARVEMSPPTWSEIPQIRDDIARFKNLLASKYKPSGKGGLYLAKGGKSVAKGAKNITKGAKDLAKGAKALTSTAKSLTKGAEDLTVREAWLRFLVGLEVALWFFLGETIGKRHIVGYEV